MRGMVLFYKEENSLVLITKVSEFWFRGATQGVFRSGGGIRGLGRAVRGGGSDGDPRD